MPTNDAATVAMPANARQPPPPPRTAGATAIRMPVATGGGMRRPSRDSRERGSVGVAARVSARRGTGQRPDDHRSAQRDEDADRQQVRSAWTPGGVSDPGQPDGQER